MNKLIITCIFLIFSFININAEYQIYFLYKGFEYLGTPVDKNAVNIDSFNALAEIDQSQTHRILLTSIEKSRLQSLFFVGDKYQFNNVQVELVDTNIYKVTDIINNFSIAFQIGKFDGILIKSAINFGFYKNKTIIGSQFDILDKIASSLTVKYLLRRMTGKIEYDDKQKTEKKFTKEEMNKEFQTFLDQLKNLSEEEIIDYLTKYAELNFELIPQNKDEKTKVDIYENWVAPVDLYFNKIGDYKSFAFFYYYVFKKIKYESKIFLVIPLIRKDEDQLKVLKELFLNRNNKDFLENVHDLELQYKRVNPDKILKEFSEIQNYNKQIKPSQIFYYLPPDIQSSVFIATVKIGRFWFYTTGQKWVKTEITNPEMICYDYAFAGCYYSMIDTDYLDNIILKNLPFTEEDLNIIWDVYFPSK